MGYSEYSAGIPPGLIYRPARYPTGHVVQPWDCVPPSIGCHKTQHSTRHGIPSDTVSHATWYPFPTRNPTRHGVGFSTAAKGRDGGYTAPMGTNAVRRRNFLAQTFRTAKR